MKGRSLQMEGQVKREDPGEDELVHAQVVIDDEDQFEVIIRPEGEDAALAECDCAQFAHGRFCPHIWATILDINHRSSGPGATSEELAARKLRPPKARKRAGVSTKPVRSAEPQWMGRLSLLRPNRDELDEAAADLFPIQRQVCYVVRPRLSSRHNGLVIELRQRSAIASGWSKPKPLKIGPETLSSLADPVDRELCALMLGAVWVSEQDSAETYRLERGHATYRVPEGAARTILRQMIGTGRCFFDVADDEEGPTFPLVWDEKAGPPANPEQKPWRLFFHGEEQDDGSLELNLQARRLGRRMTVDEPALLLGGPDGILFRAEPEQRRTTVAPFDDRDAFRWVQQFRDSRYAQEDNAARSMTVSKEEVGRFLDRLYMLPQLPEIDLPEHLGRDEKRIDPVARLDLFSPGSQEAKDLLPASSKNQLVAKLWFDYGGGLVNPTQPGRFITLQPEAAEGEGEGGDGDAKGEAAAGGEGSDDEGQPEVEAGSVAVAEADGGDGDGGNHKAEPEADDTGDGDADAEADPDLEPVPEGAQLIRRSARSEREAIAVLGTLGLRHLTGGLGNALVLPMKRMNQVTDELLRRSWEIHADQQIVRAAGPPSLSITSGIDWFELRGTVTFTREDGEQEEVDLPRILDAARKGSSMIELGDGSQGLLPEQWLESHGLLTTLGKLHQDHLRFKSSQAAMLDALLGEDELSAFDQRFAEARDKLHRFEGIDELAPAEKFAGTLRTYQREGLGWLGFLRWFGMGGILADDMGLGKTVQVLAMLQARKLGIAGHTAPPAPGTAPGTAPGNASADGGDTSGGHRPSLIVVPRSVVFNWLDEAEKFTPDLNVIAYTGPDRAEMLKTFPERDVVITSYGLMRRDVEPLSEVGFDYVVLDEAQAIKNPASQSAKAARLLPARHRMALTGTPIENHLGDLWSIFEFLNPGMLGANAKFSEMVRTASASSQRSDEDSVDAQAFAGPNSPGSPPAPGSAPAPGSSADADTDADDDTAPTSKSGNDKVSTLAQVAQALRPFILRRTKKQVLTDLPEKTEQTIVCEMEPAQRKVYDELRQYYRGTLLKQLDTSGGEGASGGGSGGGMGKSAFMVLEALLRLRQAACHPALINKDGSDPNKPDTTGAPSAKLDALEDRLADVIDEGSKALVFSQFTSMLALIRERLDAKGIRYAYLDGQTRNRREVVERFQEDPEQQVFLISLKAGGVGLNLTAAEYVFIMDPWWNPAVEQQAIDRTHRIGQTKPVFAYRLVCEDTVEQRILDLQSRKRKLADAIVGGEDNLIKSLTREDLEQLLA